MHRVLILGGDKDLQSRVSALLSDLGPLDGLLTLDQMPGEIALARILQTQRPDVVFVVVTSMLAVSDFMQRMNTGSPGTPVLALSQYTDPRTVSELMHAGVRGLIPIPILRSHFFETFRDAVGDVRKYQRADDIIPQLSAFLPGKGGSGTSRLACHFSLSLAAEAERSPGGRRALLLDLDMSSGLIRYLFERTNAYTLVEMIESGVPIDGIYWDQLISRIGNLDLVLGGRPNPRHPLSPARMKQVLEVAAQRYQNICVDLSGNLETFSLEVLRRAQRIFLVTSADPTAVQLARERFQYLDKLGHTRKVNVLLNRFAGSASIPTQRISNEIGVQIAAEFDFDDRRAIESMAAAKPFDDRVGLTKRIAQAATRLVTEPARAQRSLQAT